MRIYIANDTTGYHAGSTACMQALRKLWANHEEIATHKVFQEEYNPDALGRCDALVVNGEGTIHHQQKGSRYLCHLIAQAQLMGKTVYLLNALFQEEPGTDWDRVLPRIQRVIVREPWSAHYILRLGKQATVCPDMCCFAYDPTENVHPADIETYLNQIVVGGQLGKMHGGILDLYANNFKFPRLKLSHAQPRTFSQTVQCLTHAKCYVTAQHHGVYAAALAGIPFVALRSNSHKIESFLQWMGYPIEVTQAHNPSDLSAAVFKAIDNAHWFAALHEKLWACMDRGLDYYKWSIPDCVDLML